MKKIILLVSLLAVMVPGSLLWAADQAGWDAGCTRTDFFILYGNTTSNYGEFNTYYDDDRKTMVICILVPGSISPGGVMRKFYCYENENPKLYNTILTSAQKSMEDGNPANSGHPYHSISLWFKTVSTTNYIKGIRFTQY